MFEILPPAADVHGLRDERFYFAVVFAPASKTECYLGVPRSRMGSGEATG